MTDPPAGFLKEEKLTIVVELRVVLPQNEWQTFMRPELNAPTVTVGSSRLKQRRSEFCLVEAEELEPVDSMGHAQSFVPSGRPRMVRALTCLLPLPAPCPLGKFSCFLTESIEEESVLLCTSPLQVSQTSTGK